MTVAVALARSGVPESSESDLLLLFLYDPSFFLVFLDGLFLPRCLELL
jgi:hypothetical protein